MTATFLCKTENNFLYMERELHFLRWLETRERWIYMQAVRFNDARHEMAQEEKNWKAAYRMFFTVASLFYFFFFHSFLYTVTRTLNCTSWRMTWDNDQQYVIVVQSSWRDIKKELYVGLFETISHELQAKTLITPNWTKLLCILEYSIVLSANHSKKFAIILSANQNARKLLLLSSTF